MIPITHCPNCHGTGIRRVCQDWQGQIHGEKYTVPGLTFHECPDCGERVFDREAMRRIEAQSPAFAKPARRSA